MEELRDANGLTEKEFLAAYKQKNYPKPSLTADMAIFRASQQPADSLAEYELLLIRRGGHPYLGCWALPGGFVEPNESCDEAARRELFEETGLSDVPLEQLGLYSTPGRDPRAWTASGAHIGVVPAGCAASAGDDAADARWFKVHVSQAELPRMDQPGTTGIRLDFSAASISGLFVEFEVLPHRFGLPRARVLRSEGFAFDHAQIIADAYLALTGANPL